MFSGETVVHIDGGELEEIQFIGVEMKVLSRCENTGEISYRSVVMKFEHQDVPVYDFFYFANGELDLSI